jgi:NADPH:quinone reductase-like Zn-dependent oxidoreductase
MRAVLIDEYGPPEVLHLGELPVGEPGPGQVRVRVTAAAVNATDANTRAGLLSEWVRTPFPLVLGWDLAGLVDAAGPGVTRWRPGDAVIGLWDQLSTGVGSYAETALVDADLLAPAPTSGRLDDAAALPLSAMTAKGALDLLDLPAEATLVVTGAAGSVGGFAVQLAKHRGLAAIAVADRSDRQLAFRLGAAELVDRTTPVQTWERLADAVLHTAGPSGAIAAVRDGGRYVTVVPGSAPDPERGIQPQTYLVQPDGTALAELSRLVDRNALTLRIADVMPLARADAAHRRLEAGGLRGKLLLDPAR